MIPRQAGPQHSQGMGPPPWSPPGPRPPSQGTSPVLWVVLGLVVVLVIGGGLGFYFWQRTPQDTLAQTEATAPTVGSGDSGTGGRLGGAAPESPSPSTEQSTEASPSGVYVPGEGTVTEDEALADLQQLRSDSLQRLVLDGRWVAQVASKSVGISDPLQTALNGSHTFYASDILAESLAAVQVAGDPGKVYVLWGTDFGKRSQAPDGSPYWVTVVDGGFTGSAAVNQWCQSAFPTLTAQQLADTCAPRQLNPPHS